jgi:hypothetical protein
MSETLTHFQTTSQDILNLAAMSLSAAPDFTEAERTMRSRAVIQGAMEFRPADAAQTILASLILGHYLTIMDGLRDIAGLTLTPAEAARARMVAVAQTKLLPHLLRELRIERKETLARAAAEHDEPTEGDGSEAAYEASLAQYLSSYTGGLATLENASTLTPAAAAKVREALDQAVPLAPLAPPRQEISAPGPVTGSRAQRRAMMKRNGAFKRTA